MIPSSAELAAAVESGEQVPTHAVSIDWAGDGHDTSGSGAIDNITADVTSIQIDRMLTTDLPDEVRLVEGSGVASCTLTLARRGADETETAAWTYSSHNPDSPLAAYPRRARDVTVDIGYVSAAGVERHRRFTGRTRRLVPNPDDGSATIEALDYRELLTDPVTLPPIVADAEIQSVTDTPRKPGLESTSLVSWICYQSGIVLSPQPRAECRLWMPMHGTAWPWIGDAIDHVLYAYRTRSGALPERMRYDSGPFLLGTAEQAAGDVTTWKVGLGSGNRIFGTNARSGLRWEMWVKYTAGATLSMRVQPDDAGVYYTEFHILSTGQMRVSLKNTGVTVTSVNGPSVPADGAWHLIGCHTADDLGAARFHVDGTTTLVAFASTTAGSLTTEPGLDLVATLTGPVQLAELHITSGIATGTAWLTSVTPGAVVDRGVNRRMAGVIDTAPTEAWELLVELARAEQAVVYHDETGVLQWRTRSRMTSTEGQTVQRTVSSSTDLLALSSEESIDQVRNVVRVGYTQVDYVRGGEVYAPNEKIYVLPGATRTLTFSAPGPINSRLVIAAGINSNPEGGGTTYTYGTHVTAVYGVTNHTEVSITFTNKTGTTVWFVDAGGEAALTLTADYLDTGGTGGTQEYRKQASIDTYGEQVLPVAASPWVQTASQALGLAVALIADLADPAPVLTGLSIIADPRLQLADRVRIECSGIVLDGEYWITGISEVSDDSGYTMRVAARRAADVLIWGQGRWGQEVWG